MWDWCNTARAGRLARMEAVDSLLNFHSAPCIAVQRGAKFGGALPQPFVCLADRTRPMWHEFRVGVSEHCQRFGNCLGGAQGRRRSQGLGGAGVQDVGLGSEFPVIREKTGNFAQSLPLSRQSVRIGSQIPSVIAKFPAQRNRELLSREQGILHSTTGNVLAQSGNRLSLKERIGDSAADRKLSPGVDMEARQERFCLATFADPFRLRRTRRRHHRSPAVAPSPAGQDPGWGQSALISARRQ